MNSHFITNEDERRILYEYVTDENFRSAKVVIAKESMKIGNHFHLKKDETFFLVTGKFISLQLGNGVAYDIPAPYKVEVGRGVFHKFVLEPGSILLGVGTEPFDETDEIKQQ